MNARRGLFQAEGREHANSEQSPAGENHLWVSLEARVAACLPWYRAVANSFSLGNRFPWLPAMGEHRKASHP